MTLTINGTIDWRNPYPKAATSIEIVIDGRHYVLSNQWDNKWQSYSGGQYTNYGNAHRAAKHVLAEFLKNNLPDV